MRPVQLVMDGFASFRDKTVLDFTDADYFALVGATGAGKSTVIDAITFALYGTVPRWNDQRMITPALAPTATRGVVRLIFDADGQRYAVAREARRSGGKTSRVSMHNSRLERLHDPDDLDGYSDVLAADSEVTDAVQELLGLSYQHFTTCVALPQGQFAEFLHAKASDRQDILSSLLGHQLYDQLHGLANTRARDQRATVTALDTTLAGYGDATAQHVADLTARAEELEQMQTWLTNTGLPDLDHAATAVTDTNTRLTELTTQADAFAAFQIPADVAGLDADLAAATGARDQAAEELREAETGDTEAGNKVAAFRPRHELHTLRQQWTDLTQAYTALPELIEKVTAAEAAHRAAHAATEAAEKDTEQLRVAAERATSEAHQATTDVDTATKQADTLARITPPDDLDELSAALADLARRRAGLDVETEAAEDAYAAAVAALDAATPEASLTTGRRAAAAVHDTLTTDLAGWDARDQATADLADADQAVAAAVAALDTARSELKAAQLADQAGALRAHLHAGQPCPVCEQPVTTIPAGHNTSHIADADRAVTDADNSHRHAEKEHTRLDRAHRGTLAARAETLRHAYTARTELHTTLSALRTSPPTADATADLSTLLDALGTPLTPHTARDDLSRIADTAGQARTVLDAAAARRDVLQQDVTTTDGRRRAAANTRRALDNDSAALDTQQHAATRALHAARDTVSSLGAPAVDLADLTAAWGTLTQWARAERTTRTQQLPALRNTADTAAQTATAARDKHTDAADALTALRGEEGSAATELATLTQTRDTTARRQQELRAALTGQPTRDRVIDLITELDQLELAATNARDALTTARGEHAAAQQELDALEARARGSRTQLTRARDPLTRYGAPTITATTLAAAWNQLAGWAQQQEKTLTADLTKARAASGRAEKKYQAAAAKLIDTLTRHELTPPDPDSPTAELRTAVTARISSAVASAHAATCNAADRLRDRQRIEEERAEATEQAQVAGTLANLLRSDAFQSWLLESALTSLVADASDILLEMSSGQFELRARNKDIEVIDHNDADATRPVRTLSGGETFQASLALALALSRQVAALAASGAAKLESIFLDEGFGTLDETTLEVVANTLDALSSERMVGLITHVTDLANRIPTRFQVTRTGSTSRIERIAP
jgi:exonuclease SbcC